MLQTQGVGTSAAHPIMLPLGNNYNPDALGTPRDGSSYIAPEFSIGVLR